MAGSVNADFNFPDSCLIGGTDGMDQLIITGALGKIGVVTNEYLSGVIVFISI